MGPYTVALPNKNKTSKTSKTTNSTQNTSKTPKIAPNISANSQKSTENSSIMPEINSNTGKIDPPTYREETFVPINLNDANKLKSYNVVVGSFSIVENAERVQMYLIKEGYNPVIVKNNNNMYQVIAASVNTYEAANTAKKTIAEKYRDLSDAWILVQKR
jgi:cell division protein FtsN